MLKQGFRSTKILVPTDFSPSAEIALQTAAAIELQNGACIHLLNVIPMLPINSESGYSAFFHEEKYLEYSRMNATDRLTAACQPLLTSGIQASFQIEVGNDVVGNIMMVLATQASDLVVLSTHGLSGWRPMVFGSIAEKVIKLVECPLLLLRTPRTE